MAHGDSRGLVDDKGTRRPLKHEPLPTPGESLGHTSREFFDDQILTPALGAIFIVVLAAHEWIRWFLDAPPQPGALTVLALGYAGYVGWRVWRVLPQYRALKLGRDGETFVGQSLEALRTQGAQVLHDIPGPGFNLDHVVVHASGIYVVETKTRSKPKRGQTKILYDGQDVYLNGVRAEPNPLSQARAGRNWLHDRLRSMTDHSLPVRSVIIFPGWYVERTDEGKRSDIWVLHERGLPGFIKHEREVLSAEQIALAVDCLERYVRAERK